MTVLRMSHSNRPQPDTEGQIAAQGRSELRHLMHAGLKSIYFPIVELTNGTPVGYEALTRFADGSPPQVRFEQARDLGLARELESAAIIAAIEQMESFENYPWLSLNISPTVLLDPPRELTEALARAPIPLVLELVEYESVADYAALRRARRTLSHSLERGVRWALDDVGAGAAGFSHLLELPCSFIKLDRGLIKNLAGDARRQALIAALASFADAVGSEIIAEGVEYERQRELLLELGVKLAQGYLFWRPPEARGGFGTTPAIDVNAE